MDTINGVHLGSCIVCQRAVRWHRVVTEEEAQARLVSVGDDMLIHLDSVYDNDHPAWPSAGFVP